MKVTDEKFKGLWQGEPCLIIGAGRNNYEPFIPELNNFSGKIVGCNTAFRVGYRTDMIIWVDGHIYTDNRQEIENIDCLKFSTKATIEDNDCKSNINWIKAVQPERFSDSFDAGMYPADLTGYLALNTAYLMGCNPIYLYGFISDSHPEFAKMGRFRWAAKKAAEDGRQIYVANRESMFCKSDDPIFQFVEIPIIKKQPPTRKRGKGGKKVNVV